MKPHNKEILGLAMLFAVLYFVQGIAEPTEGLIAQPVRSMLRDWGLSATTIGLFSWVIAIPWCIKPLFGFLTDFVPFFGLRRKSYLLLASLVTSVSLLVLFLLEPQRGAYGILLAGLFLPTFGIALADVTIDGLMVEKGQPRGITGQLQSVQWTAMYSATIVTGVAGGWLSQHHYQNWGFLVCALSLLPVIALVVLFVRETPRSTENNSWREDMRIWWNAVRHPGILAASLFLFLWNFNPFSSGNVLHAYMTSELGMSEQFFGYTISIQAIASVVASLLYGFYCRRVPVRWLTQVAIVCGILATIGYWFIYDERSTILVSWFVGFVYMTGSLIQYDLAARVCPLRVAASVFSLLMAVSNIGMSLSPAAGGFLYDYLAEHSGREFAFQVLVGIGSLTTACCWFLVPRLLREAESQQEASSSETQGTSR